MTTAFDREIFILDHFFVDIFNRILMLEEKWLNQEGLSDLSITEIHMLSAIAQREDASMSSVAKQASLTNGTVTTMVKKLEKKGYVLRRQDAEDKRIVRVILSDKGRSANQQHDQFHRNFTGEILRELEPNEREVFVKGISRVNQYFTQMEGNG